MLSVLRRTGVVMAHTTGSAARYHGRASPMARHGIAPWRSSVLGSHANRGLCRSFTASAQSATANTAATGTAEHGLGRLLVVLDMDECMIHSHFDEEVEGELRQKEHRPDANAEGDEGGSELPVVRSFMLTMSDGSECRVSVRPGLEDFLRACCEHFDTYVFTAGVEMYASPLLDKLEADTGVKFQGRFYRRSCRRVQELYLKDLNPIVAAVNQQRENAAGEDADKGTVVPHTLERCVLVDNNPVSFIAQPTNGIPVPNFYGKPEEPIFPAVLKILHELSAEPDVQVCLEKMLGADYVQTMNGHRTRILGPNH